MKKATDVENVHSKASQQVRIDENLTGTKHIGPRHVPGQRVERGKSEGMALHRVGSRESWLPDAIFFSLPPRPRPCATDHNATVWLAGISALFMGA